MNETVETPAGKFVNCLQEKDTDALDPGEVADRFYAPGIGQIKDDLLSLVAMDISIRIGLQAMLPVELYNLE